MKLILEDFFDDIELEEIKAEPLSADVENGELYEQIMLIGEFNNDDFSVEYILMIKHHIEYILDSFKTLKTSSVKIIAGESGEDVTDKLNYKKYDALFFLIFYKNRMTDREVKTFTNFFRTAKMSEFADRMYIQFFKYIGDDTKKYGMLTELEMPYNEVSEDILGIYANAITYLHADYFHIEVYNNMVYAKYIDNIYKNYITVNKEDFMLIDLQPDRVEYKTVEKYADIILPKDITDTKLWANLYGTPSFNYKMSIITNNYGGRFSSRTPFTDKNCIDDDLNGYGDRFSVTKTYEDKIARKAFDELNKTTHKAKVYLCWRASCNVVDMVIEIDEPYIYKDNDIEIAYKIFLCIENLNTVTHLKQTIIPVLQFIAMILGRDEKELVVDLVDKRVISNHIAHGCVGEYYKFDHDYIMKHF